MQQERHRPPTKGFRCKEDVEKYKEHLKSVIFKCNLPTLPYDVLEFHCREPSCGALEGEEKSVFLTDEDFAVDPNFFDKGYSMAASTGFKVWTGTRLLIEALSWPQETDCDRLKRIQERIKDNNGTRIVELGAGVGVVGTYLSAALGSHVLLTDLPTLVENAIDINMERNERILSKVQKVNDDDNGDNNNSCPSWLVNGRKIGKGWADSTPLDWNKPIKEQLSDEQASSIDIILASDVVFLESMTKSLFDTVEALFQASNHNEPTFILSFQKRDPHDGQASESFTTVDGVLLAVKKRGWTIDCLAWRKVVVKKQDSNGTVRDDESEVFLFEIFDVSSSSQL
jgi:hypothetical protein